MIMDKEAAKEAFEPDLVEAFILARTTLLMIGGIDSEPRSKQLALDALSRLPEIA